MTAAGKSTFRTLRYADKSEYKGDFFDDKKHGKGILRSSYGSTYEGDFIEDMMAHGVWTNLYWLGGLGLGLAYLFVSK